MVFMVVYYLAPQFETNHATCLVLFWAKFFSCTFVLEKQNIKIILKIKKIIQTLFCHCSIAISHRGLQQWNLV